MTAIDLLKKLRAAGCAPTVEGPDLVFGRPVPADLFPLVELLATGLRAALTGRRWYGIDEHGRGVGPREWGSLATDLPLPRSVVLLCVEGENAGWHRVTANAANEHPTKAAFTAVPVERKARSA